MVFSHGYYNDIGLLYTWHKRESSLTLKGDSIEDQAKCDTSIS